MTSYWTGTRVRLRGPEHDDWRVNKTFDEFTADLRAGGQMWPPRSEESYRKGTAEQASSAPDADTFSLAIETVGSGELVGVISTHGVDRTTGTFGFGIMVGRPHQRKGYGSEAIVLVLGYMFGERRYQKCNSVCYSYNDGSLEMHRRLGFVEEGRVRRNRFFSGRHFDDVLFGMTVEEYTERYPFPGL